jgi:predicted AAA+ superfamily ATPase
VEHDRDRDKRNLLQNYYRTVFYKDILDRYGIRAKHVLDSIMDYCLNTYSELFSISKFEKRLKANNIPGSKRTIANYLRYLEDAFFILVNEKFSYSPRKRVMNPKKTYLMDTGFCNLGTEFTENKGKLLENVVALELYRGQEETFYFKERSECDFVVKKGRRPAEAIQVCWELNDRNRDRELSGLLEAADALGVGKAYILTHNQERVIRHKRRRIEVVPTWRWLLESG